MIRYAAERYGSDHVAQIVTFSTIKARAAVRDAARVLDSLHRRRTASPRLCPLVMGRDTPLAACMEKTDGHEDGYGAAAELREMYDHDPDAKKVIDVALGLEDFGARTASTPRRWSSRRTPSPSTCPSSASPTPGQHRERPDRDPVRNARRRRARSAQDGLPRPAQPLGHRTRPRPHRAHHGRAARHRQRRPRRQSRLRHAPAGRVDRGLPVGGRPMRALMRSLARPASTTSPALVALYRPGPWRPTCTTTTRTERTGASRSATCTRTWSPSWATTGPHDLPGVGHAVAQKFAGYTLEEATTSARPAARRTASSLPPSARSSKPAAPPRGTATSWPRAVRHHRALRRLRLQQVALLRLRPRRLPRPPGSRSTIRSIHGRSAHLGEGRQGQDRGLLADAAHSASRSSCPTSTAPRRVHPRGPPRRRRPTRAIPGRASSSGSQRCATSASPGRAHRGRARGAGPSPTSTTLPTGGLRRAQQADHGVPGQGRGLRLAAHPRQGLCLVLEEWWTHDGAPAGARRRIATLFSSSSRPRAPATPAAGRGRGCRSPSASSTSPAPGLRKGDARLYVSESPLLGLEAALSGTPTARSPSCATPRLRPSRGRGTRGGRRSVAGWSPR